MLLSGRKCPQTCRRPFTYTVALARRTLHCGSEIIIGPGIREGDVQWQMDQPGITSATFSVNATDETLVCDSYGYSSSHTFRFSDSGKAYSMEAEQHNSGEAKVSRRPLLGSVREVPSRRF